MIYTLNLYNNACHLYLNKTEKKRERVVLFIYLFTQTLFTDCLGCIRQYA